MTNLYRLLFWSCLISAMVCGHHGWAQQQVQGQAQYRATVNASAVIATGNSFQTVLSAVNGGLSSPARQSLTIENNNASDNCWIFIGSGSPTEAKSILLLPGGSYTRYWPYVPSDVIQATCANNSETLYVDTQ